MTNTPPAPEETSQPAASGTSRTAAVTAITVVTAVIGGAALLGAGATAAWGASTQLASRSVGQATSLDATGVTELDIEAGAADFILKFDDVSQAQLEITGTTRGDWTMRRDGDELIIRHPEFAFGWWINGWFGDEVVATLTLPNSLNNGRLDADLNLSAGSLRANGNFDELDVEVSAGEMRVEGSAKSVSANVSAGRANLFIDGVTEAELSVSAGKLIAELTGKAPAEVSVDVSAGNLELTLPDAEYAVTHEISAGNFDNGLRTNSASRNEVSVTVSAGSAQLHAGN